MSANATPVLMEPADPFLWERALPAPFEPEKDPLREVALQAAARSADKDKRQRRGPFRWFRDLLSSEL